MPECKKNRVTGCSRDSELEIVYRRKLPARLGHPGNQPVGGQLAEGDTVLLLIIIDKKAVELHLFTQESPLKVARAMSEFIKKINDIQTNSNLIPAWYKPQ